MQLNTDQKVAVARALREVAADRAFAGLGIEADDLGNIADLIGSADAVEITHHEDGARSRIEQLHGTDFLALALAVDHDRINITEAIRLANSEGRKKDAATYTAEFYRVEQLLRRLRSADACQLCTGPEFRPFGDAEESTAEAASC